MLYCVCMRACVCVWSEEQAGDDVAGGRHVVMINVSPLEYGHVLLVPQLDLGTPQVHTHTHAHTRLTALCP